MSEKEKKQGGMTRFKHGVTGNPYGRPKGVPNKMTAQMRETFTDLFENNKDKIQCMLDKLQNNPKEWLRFWLELAPYFMPKLSTTRAELTVKSTGAEHLASEDLYNLILTINNPEDAEYTDSE